MDDDRTVPLSPVPLLLIKILRGSSREREHSFTTSIRIGRSPDCEFQILDRATSKVHAKLNAEEGQWWIQDCGSKNGTFLNGKKIQHALLSEDSTIELGRRGPKLQLTFRAIEAPTEVLPVSEPTTRPSPLPPPSPLPSSSPPSFRSEAQPSSVVTPITPPIPTPSPPKVTTDQPMAQAIAPQDPLKRPSSSARHSSAHDGEEETPALNPQPVAPAESLSPSDSHILNVLSSLQDTNPPSEEPPTSPEVTQPKPATPLFNLTSAPPSPPSESSQRAVPPDDPLARALQDLESLTGPPSKTTQEPPPTQEDLLQRLSSPHEPEPPSFSPSSRETDDSKTQLQRTPPASVSEPATDQGVPKETPDEVATVLWTNPATQPPTTPPTFDSTPAEGTSPHSTLPLQHLSSVENEPPTEVAAHPDLSHVSSSQGSDPAKGESSTSLKTQPLSPPTISKDPEFAPDPEPLTPATSDSRLPSETDEPTASPLASPVHPDSSHPPESVTQVIQHYFSKDPNEEAGDQTILFRKAYHRVHKQHSRKYFVAIGIVSGLLLLVGSLAIVQQYKLDQLRETAADLFYAMKHMELEVAQLEDMFIESATRDQVQHILARRQNLNAMEQQYDKFLEELGVYNEGMSETDRLIFRMARLFGECEVALPEGFLPDVYSYIEKWRSKDRLIAALNLARRHGYPEKVSEAMLKHNMPPQFFYLGLQESNLNTKAVGPKTRFGIAKGPWQFIPATAVEFGLSTGPLVNVRQFDPLDDRHNFVKATAAAAKYIHFLYNTKAQASGLLVMASYNWGYGRVRDRIGKMPKNPKERNFWQLYTNFKIPKETKDYVFFIFSAAVIGENPKLFNFDFDNPLLPKAKS